MAGLGFSVEGDVVRYAEVLQGDGRVRIGRWGMRWFGGPEEDPDTEAVTAGVPDEPGGTPEPPSGWGPLMQPWTLGVLRKFKRAPVFASLSDRDVLTKFITLPELTAQEVARMVELRRGEYLPMPNADIVYDFSIVRFAMAAPADEEGEDVRKMFSGPAQESELRVAVAGVERGIYLAYREAIAQEGVILRSLETNQAAISRGTNFILGPEHHLTYAVLYLGDTYSIVNFVVEGGLYYSRVLEQGLQDLTHDEAGRRRADRLLREIFRSVDFFSVESRGVSVDTLYLANGGTQPDPGVSKRIQYFLAERLSTEVVTLQEVAEEREGFTPPSGLLAGSLLLPLGLGLRSVSEVGV
ncbi:MAG: hypothetical protein R6W82_08955 [bacterium]